VNVFSTEVKMGSALRGVKARRRLRVAVDRSESVSKWAKAAELGRAREGARQQLSSTARAS
jgi:hypothetical protein